MKHKEMQNGMFELTVKAVVLNKEGKTIVLKRPENDEYNPGMYDLVGGYVQAGEEAETALLREIEEETGLEAEIGPLLNIVDFKKDDGSVFGKGLRFMAFVENDEVKLDEKEHSSFEWLTIEEAIGRFQDKGYEKDKKEALLQAREYLKLKDGLESWKRCVADFENYKKRQEESRKELREFAKEDILLQLLPVVDNFHASTDHVPDDQKDNAWVTGIMYIQKQLEKLLEDNGAEEIETNEGDKFNPEIHEAVSHEGKGEKIAKVVQRGYKMGSKVVRAAKVVVN